MPDLGLDDKVAAVRDIKQSATGWAGKLIDLLSAAFKSDTTPIGSAALLDAGAAAGNVPQLDADGHLPASVYQDDLIQAADVVAEVATDGTASADKVASEAAANALRNSVQGLPSRLSRYATSGAHTHTIPAETSRVLILSASLDAAGGVLYTFTDGSTVATTRGSGLPFRSAGAGAVSSALHLIVRAVNEGETITFSLEDVGESAVIIEFGRTAT